MENINKNFKAFRIYLGLKQSELASILEITQANVSQIEAGRNLPGTDLIMRMASKYPSLNLTWLIRGRGPMFHRGSDHPVKKYSQRQELSEISKTVRKLESMVRLLVEKTI